MKGNQKDIIFKAVIQYKKKHPLATWKEVYLKCDPNEKYNDVRKFSTEMKKMFASSGVACPAFSKIPNRITRRDKKKIPPPNREQVKSAIDEYIAAGGKITVIDPEKIRNTKPSMICKDEADYYLIN
jgi:hypothetical protein